MNDSVSLASASASASAVPSSALERRRGMAQEEGRSGLLQQMRSKLSVTRTEEFTGKATTAGNWQLATGWQWQTQGKI